VRHGQLELALQPGINGVPELDLEPDQVVEQLPEVTALGPATELAAGSGAIGDEAVAWRISGGYTTAITVPASSVFAKPSTLTFPEAASLLLANDR
jgi:NADPH:quinone reductase-like Zn-dependent oxidoreductase